MKREDRIKIDVISNIDEAFIDEATQTRIMCSSSSRKTKKFFLSPKFTAIAASLALIVSSLILIFANVSHSDKQIPVYQGMTVSSEFPVQDDDTAILLSTSSSSTKGSAVFTSRDNDRIKDKVDDFLNISAEKDIYYANPGDDVYITVHIDNPDNFEILSFTLNGIKYSSYMFEAGSDMENLVLKVNVGDEPGLATYTIDAIKYVDGEKIKNVKMLGDKTVNIGIYNPEQPTVKITNTSLAFSRFTFTAKVTDTEGLVAATDGTFYAILIKENAVVETVEFDVGEEAFIRFSDLAPGSYTYAVVAVFDAYDGEGYSSHVLYSGSFTNTIQLDVTFTGIETYPKKTVSFDVASKNNLVTIEMAELIRESDGTVLATIEDLSKKSFELPDNACGTCYIRISGSYENGSKRESCSFRSATFSIPMQPVVGVMSRPYDSTCLFMIDKETYAVHQAVDFAPTTDDMNVYSCTDGKVKKVIKSAAFPGTTVEIEDANEIIYAYYLLENANVEVGDEVKMGDVIGAIGSFDEGFESEDGPHLHLVVREPNLLTVSGVPVVPPFVTPKELAVSHELLFCHKLTDKRPYTVGNSAIHVFNTRGIHFSDVVFEYSTTSPYLNIDGGTFTFDFDAMPTKFTEIEITVTARLGNIVKSHVSTITVEKYWID